MFEDGQLRLIEPQQTRGRRVTIDLFFRTLAQAYGQRAVSVILSGSDSDGTIGLKHVRAQGGVTIAQDPNEAEYDSMPVTAISTGMVDWVLPVGQMPARLLEFVRNERRMKLPPEIADAAEPHLKEQEAPGGETISEETYDAADEEAIGKVLCRSSRPDRPRFRALQARHRPAPDRAPAPGQLAREHPAVSRFPPPASGGRRARCSRICSSA